MGIPTLTTERLVLRPFSMEDADAVAALAGARQVAEMTLLIPHPYSRADVEELRRWARERPDAALLVTTQKDLVKLRVAELAGRPLWAVRIQLQATRAGGMEALDEQLRRVGPAF